MKNTLVKKISLSLMLIVIVFSSFQIRPKTAHAQWFVTQVADVSPTGIMDTTNSWMQRIKEYILDGLAWHIAKIMVQQITASVVQWINSGFSGSPSFLTNPEGFFENVGDQITGDFIANTGALSALCSPFSIDVRLALALNQAGYTRSGQYTCTLNSIISNVKNSTINGMSIGGFMAGDFKQGGWQAFIAIGEPQNNESGAYLQAQSDLLQRIGVRQGTISQSLIQGGGFMSWQDCNNVSANQAQTIAAANGSASASQFASFQQKTNTKAGNNEIANIQTAGLTGGNASSFGINTPSQGNTYGQTSTFGYSAGSPTQTGVGATTQTLGNTGIQAKVAADGSVQYQDCQTKTPGSVINSQLEKVLGSGVDQLNIAGSINQIVDALLAQLVTQVLSGGLGGASQKPSGETQSYINKLSAETTDPATFSRDSQKIQDALKVYINNSQQVVDLRQQAVSAFTGALADLGSAKMCFQTLLSSKSYAVQRNIPLINSNITAVDSLTTKATNIQGQYQATLSAAESILAKNQNQSSSASNIQNIADLQQASDVMQNIAANESPVSTDAITQATNDLKTAQGQATPFETQAQSYSQECQALQQ